MNAFTAKPDDTAVKMIAAGNRMAAMLDTSLTAPVEQWPDEAQIDAALKEWRSVANGDYIAAAGKGIDAPQPQPKPLFGDLIAQHPGLSEELAEMQEPQPQREWVGLTDEDVRELDTSEFWDDHTPADFVRLVENKLREKNGGGV